MAFRSTGSLESCMAFRSTKDAWIRQFWSTNLLIEFEHKLINLGPKADWLSMYLAWNLAWLFDQPNPANLAWLFDPQKIHESINFGAHVDWLWAQVDKLWTEKLIDFPGILYGIACMQDVIWYSARSQATSPPRTGFDVGVCITQRMLCLHSPHGYSFASLHCIPTCMSIDLCHWSKWRFAQ